MRDLKRDFPHLLNPFKPDSKVFSPKYRFSYEPGYERLSYYNGQSFKSLLYKESMAGYPLSDFMRTKITGRSIHQRKKKKKKLLTYLFSIFYDFNPHLRDSFWCFPFMVN
jgi:hypothetical protein